MRALWYLMLLNGIKSHPSMPIFNVLSQSFSVAEGSHKARWVSPGSSVHTVTLQKAFCVVPQGAHSAYSYIITSEWLQKSMECCYCRGHFPKALDNDSIPVQLPRTRLWKPSKYVQHTTNHTHILYLSNLFPQGLLVLHTVIGSVQLGVFAAFYESLEKNVRKPAWN